MNLSPLEGVGNAGCPWHPQPRVRFALVKKQMQKSYALATSHLVVLESRTVRARRLAAIR